MPSPAPGRPNSRPMVLRQEVSEASMRHVAVAERLATDLINQGFDRHGVNAILQHLRAFVEVHFDVNNSKDGRQKRG